jgi:hypothetical protein
MMGILCNEQSCRNLGTSVSAYNSELSCELHATPPSHCCARPHEIGMENK